MPHENLLYGSNQLLLPEAPEPGERDRRNNEHQMWDAARWAMPPIKRLGELDRERIDRFMRMAREHYGDCIKDLPRDWPARIPEG